MIELLHSDAADPNTLRWLNARGDGELAALAPEVAPLFAAKLAALERLLEDNKTAQVRVSEKTVHFWEAKRLAVIAILEVVKDGEKSEAELDAGAKARRDEYFSHARDAWTKVQQAFLQLHKEIIGPYVLGTSLLDILAS